MDSIQRNLEATENLLNALERDPSLLSDCDFIHRLSTLRQKHEETTNYLASKVLTDDFATSSHVVEEQFYDESLPPSRNYERGRFYDETRIQSSGKRDSWRLEEERSRDTRIKKTRNGSNRENLRYENIEIESKTKPYLRKERAQSAPKHKIANVVYIDNVIRPKKSDIFVPKPTVPQPFQLTVRKSIENTYAKKFMQDMMEEKKKKEEAETKNLNAQKFKAKPIPQSTYKPENNYLLDEKYIASMRRKVMTAAKKKFELQQQTIRRSKSEGNLSAKPVGYIPPTTYISPIPVKQNERSRSAVRRATRLIEEAETPKGIKTRQATSNMAFHLRHSKCKLEKPTVEMVGRSEPPDFRKLHANINKRSGVSPKPSTVPQPFSFESRPQTSTFRHANCNKQHISKYRRSTSNLSRFPVASNVPTTHATVLRDQTIASKIKKSESLYHNEKAYWKNDNRKRIDMFLANRSKTDEDIAMRTKIKIQQQQETSRDYLRQLEEMKQRVLNGPLIMEKQSALSQEHRLQRKYEQRMTEMRKETKKNNVRRPSENSSGTFVINREDEEEPEQEYISASSSSKSSSRKSSSSKNSKSNSSSSSTSDSESSSGSDSSSK
ncbi:unnamed protein product [Caenorhabditis angaria]|uniref:Uncharacterized protein n=1 Tax=Caenorhabditis angaria TaxID=860376 RepID=A0A9P1IRV9_9PELO|nr:unnamed protein product [Caenorhabditis angaria]